MIRPETARKLGYQWHGGQSSPLYAFASSGIVRDLRKLHAEIAANHAYAIENERSGEVRELIQLDEFVAEKLDRQDDGTWLAPWAHRSEDGGYRPVMIFTPNGCVRERHRTLRGVLDYAKRHKPASVQVGAIRWQDGPARIRLTFNNGFYTLWTMPNVPAAREFLARTWPKLTMEEIGQ